MHLVRLGRRGLPWYFRCCEFSRGVIRGLNHFLPHLPTLVKSKIVGELGLVRGYIVSVGWLARYPAASVAEPPTYLP
jgi:hypothetical protein